MWADRRLFKYPSYKRFPSNSSLALSFPVPPLLPDPPLQFEIFLRGEVDVRVSQVSQSIASIMIRASFFRPADKHWLLTWHKLSAYVILAFSTISLNKSIDSLQFDIFLATRWRGLICWWNLWKKIDYDGNVIGTPKDVFLIDLSIAKKV